jgi:hypothetical protein
VLFNPPDAAPLVPPLLALAIPFDRFRMFRAVMGKIVGMSFAPLLLAVAWVICRYSGSASSFRR